MVDQTWDVREKPILEAIYSAEEEGEDTIGWGNIVERTGLAEGTTVRAIRSLYEGEYITGIVATTFDGYDLLDIHLLPKGRRAVGQWPSDNAFQSLMGLLEARIAAEADAQRRTKLEKLRDVLRDIGVEVAGSVVGAFATQAVSL